MGHDASVVLLGSTRSNLKDVTNESGASATFKAGLAVRLATNSELQLADDSTAALIGISLGESLDDKTKIAVCRTGNKVPIKLQNEFAEVVIGDLTFRAKTAGVSTLTVAMPDTEAAGAANASLVGSDITIGIEDGVTTAQAIKTEVEATPAVHALIEVIIADGETTTAQALALETPLENGGTGYAVPGAQVFIDSATGEATHEDVGDATATGATYLSGPLTGLYPDGTTTTVALIAMQGGL